MLFSSAAYQKPLWPEVRAYYARTYDGYRMPGYHAHENQVEVMYVFFGHCTVDIAPVGQSEQSLSMGPGDFIFLDQSVPHRLKVEARSPCTMLNVEFSLAPSPGMYTLAALRQESPDFSWFSTQNFAWYMGSDAQGELFRSMDSLVTVLEERPFSPSLSRSEMALFLMRLSRAILEERNRPGLTAYVRRARAFMQRNYSRPLRIADIAREVGVHPDHLERLFRAETGLTLSRALESIRVRHAAVLLERSDHPVTDIAAQVGFSTRQQFTSAFKRSYGISPQQYRTRSKTLRYDTLE